MTNPIAKYLMACWAYDVGEPFMSDSEFDELGQYIKDNWDTLEHRHKHLIDYESCNYTSGITCKLEDLPTIIKVSAMIA